ncbi:MAG: ribosome small subunit-dependent GTPase A [Alphaproteobacteria bacterium]|nr:ribosome small subunit-dependent GTPase A [Alphaproteobacteria bacterium]
MSAPGLVVASHGRHVMVESETGERVLCHPKGKKNQALVGDRVRWSVSGTDGSIDAVDPRRNVLYRQDELRTKSFAANLDAVLLMLGAEPEFSETQLARSLIACEVAGIDAWIVLNKADLQPAFERAWTRLQSYRDMGLKVLPLCLKNDQSGLQQLTARLTGQLTLVLGPSGVGKSSLINHFVPSARAQTAEISQALNSGRHTTTHSSLHWVDREAGTALIDSPGFQSFGLHHLQASDFARAMPDLRVHADQCRFHNCTHLHEPGCDVKDALAAGNIHPQRYRIYEQLMAELNAPVKW